MAKKSKPDCIKCFSENIKNYICQDCGANQDGPIGVAYGTLTMARNHPGVDVVAKVVVNTESFGLVPRRKGC